MHFQNYTDRVFIIDNIEKEAQPLIDLFHDLDIDTLWFNPRSGENVPQLKKNRQIVFIDLMLDEDITKAKSSISEVVSLLAKAISQDLGPYGLIVWTKHKEYLEYLVKYLGEACFSEEPDPDDESFEGVETVKLAQAPLFVIPLDKMKYIKADYDYSSLLDDMEKVLADNNAGYFFLSWCDSVKRAMNKTISDVYSLCSNYEAFNEQVTFLLYRLAMNHTGLDEPSPSLSVDCYKSFDELIYANLYNAQNSEMIPKFKDPVKNPWDGDKIKEAKVYASLNSKMFLDFDAIDPDAIIPGNVYKLAGTQLEHKIEQSNTLTSGKETITFDIVHIAVELTPPCDNSNKRIGSRVVKGFVVKQPRKVNDAFRKKFLSTFKACEKWYVLNNVLIDDTVSHIIFDFRHLYTPTEAELKDSRQFEIWFRAKPKLFADILQKFSSHASRLGLSDIHVIEKK